MKQSRATNRPDSVDWRQAWLDPLAARHSAQSYLHSPSREGVQHGGSLHAKLAHADLRCVQPLGVVP
eukprot:IDg9327t1